ncbi:hypothetical protein [Streptomyces yaizuensis]|uniref:Uncharacterized protein n=1 Tax=Streptomyces yaizuensis TaxID=2989713 RepID=A0ABQ5NWR7_9ACTN|nr:hypothetical protein [Streptomyces sp. YSPA8]GLF94817.1 hypothetical protein SYYSPA8_10990 [Streptomyces sp. YSPA8]
MRRTPLADEIGATATRRTRSVQEDTVFDTTHHQLPHAPRLRHAELVQEAEAYRLARSVRKARRAAARDGDGGDGEGRPGGDRERYAPAA